MSPVPIAHITHWSTVLYVAPVLVMVVLLAMQSYRDRHPRSTEDREVDRE